MTHKITHDEPSHALQDLARNLPKSKPETLTTLLAGRTEEQLVRRGAEIDTSRIVTDGARLYAEAWAFWEQASPEQRAVLKGFTPALLSTAVSSLLALHDMSERLATGGATDAATRASADTAASSAFAAGLTLRDQAAEALGDAAGSPDAEAEVEETVGTAAQPEALARGLTGLAKLLRGWLKSKDAGLAARLELGGLDSDYADELAAAATLVTTTAAKAGGKKSKSHVTQGALDKADGQNLELLSRVIRAFQVAHDRSPTVPRLVPIATRRLLGSHKTKPAKPAPPSPAPPVEPPAS